MKRKILLVAIALISCICMYADYTQVLPLNYEDFFRADALASDGEHLERDAYSGKTQGSGGEALKADMWSLSGKSTDQAGANPVVAASTLEYGNYIDNLKGKEIILANLPLVEEATQARASIYGLKSNYDYSGAPYYMAALIQINEATGKGDILAFDGNYTANAQRARLFVNKQGSGYKLGLGWNGDPTTWTGELAFGSTHLVVIKVTPKQAGNVTGNVEEASWWLDPDLSKTEGENDVFATVDGSGEIVTSGSTKGLKSIRGITIRQRSKIAGKIAGLRFGETWADVIQTAEVPSVARIETDFGDTEVWGEVTATTDDAVANIITINGFEFVKSGLAQNDAKNFNGRILTNRMAIGNQNTGAMVTLPTVSTIERVTIYAQAGSENKDLTLQYFDYATNTWNLIETYHFADRNIHVISAVLKRNVPTRLRLINADNSKKFIYRIETFPIVEQERIATNFNDGTWGEAAESAYTQGSYPSSIINNFELNAAGLQKGSIDYLPTYKRFTQRISMDKGSNGGMITLPAVSSVAQIDIYANSGSPDRYIKLQKFNYGSDAWEDIEESWHCETTDCYRFSKILDSSEPTRLRIANADGSTKYIWKIVTYPYPNAPESLEVPEALAAENVAAHSFTARWNVVENAKGYRIVVFNNDDSNETTKEAEGGDIFQYNISGLDAATNYTYKVAAIGDDETYIDSYLSEAVEVTTSAAITDSYTRTVTNGNYGTICLPKAAPNLSDAGAVFFEVAGKVMDGSKLTQIVFDQVTSLEAGKPYVFQATSDELNIPLTGGAVAEPDNSSSNGLIGAFTVDKVPSSNYVYVLSNNLLYCSKDQSYYVGENRAYFKVDVMSEYSGAAPAPGRRRVVMHAAEEQVATALDELTTTNSCCKIVRNGQIIIIRNGVQFDVTGRQIK